MVNKGVRIEVTGMDEVAAKLKSASTEIANSIGIGIKKAGFYVQSEVQESIAGQRAEPRSVDTGRFLNSIKTVFPAAYVANVETNVEYAQHLEYGTSKMLPRSHFRNTVARESPNVVKIIKQEISK